MDDEGREHRVDAREAIGVQVGDGNTQIIYNYERHTWSDGLAPPPLVSVAGAIASPYRGLGTFDERDAAFFFGREAAIDAVLDRLSEQTDTSGLLVVSGVSGAGKSSLLRAGILPRVRGTGLRGAPQATHWPCLVLTPTRAPLDELALHISAVTGTDPAAVRSQLHRDPADFAFTVRQVALAHAMTLGADEPPPPPGRHRLLIVVDQFEQLFTQCQDAGQRQAFVTALVAATAGGDQAAAVVVLGVRADFEARCADYPELAAAVQDRYLVTAMSERQLRMAIAEPARVAGTRVEDDLVDALLHELTERDTGSSARSAGAGVLPLLSHALDVSWRGRLGPTLTWPDYERTGGIEGAVASSAQSTFDRLTPVQQTLTRRIFIRLTATDSAGIDTADRVTRRELLTDLGDADTAEVDAVLEQFAGQRLLTLSADAVQLSHEVLLTAWPLLRDDWLAENRADRMVRTRLRASAVDWEAHDRDPAYLYDGSLLDVASESVARAGSDGLSKSAPHDAERAFLTASGRARRHRVLLRRGFTIALVVLLAGVSVVSVLAVRAGQRANRQRDIAVARQLIDQSQALSGSDPRAAQLDSVAAWSIDPTPDARYAMVEAAAQPEVATLTGDTDAIGAVAFSPDAKMLATASYDHTLRLWNTASHEQIGTAMTQPGSVESVAFSPDGAMLVTGGADHTVRLWNVATHQQIGAPLTGHSNEVRSVAFSPKGDLIASGSIDQTVRLWNVATHQQVGSAMSSGNGEVHAVQFSPDGTTLASSSAGGSVTLWNVADRRDTLDITQQADSIDALAYSPDGKSLATGNTVGEVAMWATSASGDQPSLIGILKGNKGAIHSVAFSPDGTTLAVGSTDNTIRLWNVATSRQVGAALTGDSDVVNSVAFSPDGSMLASGSADFTARLWDIADQHEIGPSLDGDTKPIGCVDVSRDGKTLASASADGTVRLWDVATHREIGRPIVAGTKAAFAVAFNPDGNVLVTGDDDGTVRLWNVASEQPIGNPLRGGTKGVNTVVFSPDGKTIASGDTDGSIRMWDVATESPLGPSFGAGTGKAIQVIAFSPDGRTIASVGYDHQLMLWDVRSHGPVGVAFPKLLVTPDAVAFSPDGKTIATGQIDNTIRLWSVASHREIGGPLLGNTFYVESVAFSPDGRTLVSAGADGTVRVWDVATRKQIGDVLDGYTGAELTAVFTPDGRTIVSGSVDNNVHLWDVSYLGDAEQRICTSAGGPYTRSEWAQQVPAGPSYRKLCR